MGHRIDCTRPVSLAPPGAGGNLFFEERTPVGGARTMQASRVGSEWMGAGDRTASPGHRRCVG
eukprot:6563014-Pyramimonas_sp.AAC.1